jgi:hypothetical protein
MSCLRCPHHVRHGQMSLDKKTLTFTDICGLKTKAQDREDEAIRERLALAADPMERKVPAKDIVRPKRRHTKELECINYPFPAKFEYRHCQVYVDTFKSTEQKNDVLPTKDFQYSEALMGGSITDMELL